MPSSRGELSPAYAAGILAGAGEEIAFRGFLLWYLAALAGVPA
jgi:membrane protease YdiL (CAAX protease family)